MACRGRRGDGYVWCGRVPEGMARPGEVCGCVYLSPACYLAMEDGPGRIGWGQWVWGVLPRTAGSCCWDAWGSSCSLPRSASGVGQGRGYSLEDRPSRRNDTRVIPAGEGPGLGGASRLAGWASRVLVFHVRSALRVYKGMGQEPGTMGPTARNCHLPPETRLSQALGLGSLRL